MLDNFDEFCYYNPRRLRDGKFGGIAQLGERLNGIQEVSGSIPLISTTKILGSSMVSEDFLFFRDGQKNAACGICVERKKKGAFRGGVFPA